MDTKKLKALILKDGGCTYDTILGTKISFTKGYAVASEIDSHVITLDKFKEVDIRDIMNNISFNNDNSLVGFWVDSGLVYIESVFIMEDLEKAKKLGKLTNQKAIYDFENDKEITL